MTTRYVLINGTLLRADTVAMLQDTSEFKQYVRNDDYVKLERELAAAQKDAERYTRVRRLAIQSRLPKQWLEGWADTRLLDAAIDAAIES